MIIISTRQSLLRLLTSWGLVIQTTHLLMSGHGRSSCCGIRHPDFHSRDVRQQFCKGGSLSALNTSAEEPVPFYRTHLTLWPSPMKIKVLLLSCYLNNVGNNAQVKSDSWYCLVLFNYCSTNSMIIQLEAYADDLTRVTIWQSGTHEDANPQNLLWSRRLRNLVSERLRLVGVKATTVMRGTCLTYCKQH